MYKHANRRRVIQSDYQIAKDKYSMIGIAYPMIQGHAIILQIRRRVIHNELHIEHPIQKHVSNVVHTRRLVIQNDYPVIMRSTEQYRLSVQQYIQTRRRVIQNDYPEVENEYPVIQCGCPMIQTNPIEMHTGRHVVQNHYPVVRHEYSEIQTLNAQY